MILLLDFPKQTFEWTDLPRLLGQWGLSQSQFVDACLLAGTEYCLTCAQPLATDGSRRRSTTERTRTFAQASPTV